MYRQAKQGLLGWAGHEGYVVGGAVRDLLLGLQPKDFDIVTSATPKQASPWPSVHVRVPKRSPTHASATGQENACGAGIETINTRTHKQRPPLLMPVGLH